ncbi:MAG: hypothetical protein N3G80_04225 [Candidatus Micrarchaeota archaeon]|nr:hypothetical protein [Candidatus Micrarchaeota archaeon]
MLPCSKVYWKILPAISRQLAIGMEKQGAKREFIAKVLGTTEAAVSQYISGKRGNWRISQKARQACLALAKKLVQKGAKAGKVDVEIAKIIALAKKESRKAKNPCLICAR